MSYAQIPPPQIQPTSHPSSPKLIHKTLMERPNPPHPLRPRRQKRSPEMQRPLLLPESTTRNDAHARRIQEAEAVELVRGAVFLLCLFDSPGREGDGWEEVH